MNARTRLIIILISLIGLLVIAGCSTNSSVIKSKHVSQQKLKVGVLAPLTGEYAFLGEDIRDAILMSGDQYDFIFEDDASCNINQGVTATNKLINIDKIDILISTCTNLVNSLYALTDEQDIPYIQLLEGPIYESDHLYQMLPFSLDLFYTLGIHYSKYDVCLISEQTDLMENNVEYFIDGINSARGAIVLHEKTPPEQIDFKNELLKCKQEQATAILPLISIDSKINLVKQFFELGLNEQIDLLGEANDEFNIQKLIGVVGTNNLQGLELTGFDLAGQDEFKKLFKLTFNRDPQMSAFLAYDAVQLITRFLRKDNSFSHTGVMGKYEFDKNGNSHAQTYLKRWTNDSFEIIKELNKR